MTEWEGRPALVTGASSGIGRSVARRLAQAGLRVAATARREDRLTSLREECAGFDGELVPVAADLRDEAQIGALFDTVRAELGGVDLLVNNAGVGRRSPLMSGSAEAWREMLELNVLALCVCTREAIQDMQRRDVVGHIVHVSSMAAHRVPKGSGVYAATKHAVKALTEALRIELRAERSPIRVTAVSPGFVETEFAENYHGDPSAAAKTYGRFPVIQPDEIADAVLYVIRQPAHVQIHDILLRPTEQES